jgi:hypothetical protein
MANDSPRTPKPSTETGNPSRERTQSDETMEQHEPPFTTKKGITSPKFGSAGSGGAELEPLPEQHDKE